MKHPFYVVEQGAKLRYHNRCLKVEKDGDILAKTPLGHIAEVILYGNISVTTPAIGALLSKGVEIVFLKYNGKYRGRLTGEITPHVPIRRAQYRALDKPTFVLEMAKNFVSAKLRHQAVLLQRNNRENKDKDISKCIRQIKNHLKNIPHKTRISSLLGVEGSASASYFRGFRRLVKPGWKFHNRNRRPPKDPINVLLSFGYTLITQVAHGSVQAVGLDPYAGFLHKVAYNRPAMGLDLVEEFRPLLDGIVLWVCNSGVVTVQDFSPGSKKLPVVLSDTGKRNYIKAYEKRMNQKYMHQVINKHLTIKQCIVEQARQIVNAVKKQEPVFKRMNFR